MYAKLFPRPLLHWHFNQEKKDLVEAFSVIVKTDGLFAALLARERERDCRNLNIIFILLLYRGLGLERSWGRRFGEISPPLGFGIILNSNEMVRANCQIELSWKCDSLVLFHFRNILNLMDKAVVFTWNWITQDHIDAETHKSNTVAFHLRLVWCAQELYIVFFCRFIKIPAQ